jgi:hypothetical protein
LKSGAEYDGKRDPHQNHKGASDEDGKPETFHGPEEGHPGVWRVSDMVSENF